MAQRANYISHRVSAESGRWAETPETPQYTSQNHALYIGKMLRQSIRQRIVSLLGWDSQEKRVYNETFIEAALVELFAGLEPGEKGKLIICRVLSELFNGPQDVKNALSVEEEKAAIEHIARKKFKKTAKELEIINLEGLPAHAPLLQNIRKARNPDSGELNASKAFGEKDLPENPKTSLEIAQCLYVATQESPEFMEYLRNTITHRLRQLSTEKDEKLPISYYSLTEIAIRISELIHGQNIHIGAARQNIYDDIIHWIIKGDKKPFNTSALKRVARACRKINFQTVHVTTEKSPGYQRRAMRNRIARILTLTGIGAFMTGGAFYGAKHYIEEQQMEERRELENYVRDEMRGRKCYGDSPHFEIDIRLETLERMTESAQEHIEHGYAIPPDIQKKLNIPAMFQQFLLNNKDQFLAGNCFSYKEVEAVHLFIEQNRLFFQQNGKEIQPPYQNLKPFSENLLQLAQGKTIKYDSPHNTVRYEETCHSGGDPVCVPINNPLEIGIFRGNYMTYKLFTANIEGQVVLLARYTSDDESENRVFGKKIDALTAQSAAREFVEHMNKYATTQLGENVVTLWWRLGEENYINFIPEDIEEKEKVNKWRQQDEKNYRDYFGRFEYYIIKDQYRDPKTGEYKDCLKARTPQENEYSIQRAREAAKWYMQAIYPHMKD